MNKLSLEEIVKEINRLKGLLDIYNKNDSDLPSDFNYKDTILLLQHLRNKQKTFKRQEKNMKKKTEEKDVEVTINEVLGDSFEEDEPHIPEDSNEPEYLDQPPSTHLSSKKTSAGTIPEPDLVEDKKEEIKKDPKTMAKDAIDLAGRLEMWNKSCKDLFVDLRTITFTATDEEMFIEFNDKKYFPKSLYFKVDPQKPKDPKTVHAQKQFCKLIGIPHSFFMNNRPQLKMDIVKTWQSGLGADDSKGRCIVRFRESQDYCVIRAFVPETFALIQNHEIIQAINATFIKVDDPKPNVLEFACGDDRDELILHARYLSGETFKVLGEDVCVGFSVIASEVGASPLIVEALLQHKDSKTGFISSYGTESFLNAKYESIQPQEIRDIFPKLIERVTSEAPEMKERIEALKEKISPEEACLEISSWKGIPGKFKRSLFHEVSSCPEDMSTRLDFARHMSLIAKDFDSIKRLSIERAAGDYLNLAFSKQ
jgi:hypothetical protein